MLTTPHQQHPSVAELTNSLRLTHNDRPKAEVGSTSAFIPTGDMYSLTELTNAIRRQQQPLYMSPQPGNFGLAQPTPQMGNFFNRTDLFGGGMMSNSHQWDISTAQSMLNNGSDYSGLRMPTLRCPECFIAKGTGDELEIHVKTEHLQWLPFQCPTCNALRASDSQMREHVHSQHKKMDNMYIYVDNPAMKQRFQMMMDQAFLAELKNGSKLESEDGIKRESLKEEMDYEAKHTMDTPLSGNSSKRLSADTQHHQNQRTINKKRVLGECADCRRPITVGARQMHIFFHLGRDLKKFRFGCKYPGCEVEHYRKDQMENHQSKEHGKVDHDMMEDRCKELYSLSQEMSMKLLGTSDSTPGPTAALYEQRIHGEKELCTPKFIKSEDGDSTADRNRSMARGKPEQDLECRLCHKFIMRRIRGFHILWHMTNDLGIVRYGCKHCNYKHDRPQQVNSHGKQEHNDEQSCEDLLNTHEEELISTSKACFGVERLFDKEIRRRNKLKRGRALFGSALENESLSPEEDEDDSFSSPLANVKLEDSQSASHESMFKRRRTGKRSQLTSQRRPMTQSAVDEMVKLRELSKRIGGAQYFRKKNNEPVNCQFGNCGKLVVNRLSDHAYSHMRGSALFRCPKCDQGHYSREYVVRHLKDTHNSVNDHPLDNRLRFAQQIKNAIRECYPTLYVDAPLPKKEDVEKLKTSLKLGDQVLACGPEEDDKENDKSNDVAAKTLEAAKQWLRKEEEELEEKLVVYEAKEDEGEKGEGEQGEMGEEEDDGKDEDYEDEDYEMEEEEWDEELVDDEEEEMLKEAEEDGTGEEDHTLAHQVAV